jgi:Ni/Co efflux regulator RcnB
MKRIILTALALSMLAVPAAYAGSGPASGYPAQYGQKFHAPVHNAKQKADSSRVIKKRVVVHKRVVVQKRVVVKPHWVRGKRVPGWQRQHVVRDYHRFGLRKPARGQQWVKVGNEYLLISVTSGIIASLIVH